MPFRTLPCWHPNFCSKIISKYDSRCYILPTWMNWAVINFSNFSHIVWMNNITARKSMYSQVFHLFYIVLTNLLPHLQQRVHSLVYINKDISYLVCHNFSGFCIKTDKFADSANSYISCKLCIYIKMFFGNLWRWFKCSVFCFFYMLNRLNDLFGYIRQSTMVSNV